MEILKHESDLPNDIEERIRKNLTITDIIVLEPEDVPLTLPPITPEMRKVINHAVRTASNFLTFDFNVKTSMIHFLIF